MDEDSHFSWKQRFEIKNVLMMDLFTTNTQYVNCWTGMVRITCVLLWCFFSAVWTLMLTAPIHCSWNAKFLQMCSDGETNSSKSWTGNFQQRLFFSASPLSGRCVWLNITAFERSHCNCIAFKPKKRPKFKSVKYSYSNPLFSMPNWVVGITVAHHYNRV